ncbi:thioredoxin domain-containing protein [Pseudoduganella eburnea]|uniref:Thiol:disulfide interchange protein n=1 Tax=Massilia eburnea TaxID=1776165 RepID=A0A6L6QAF0_9BURK|nr:thiol:disulfide interchange protein DsbA/DsbL [Massilia eburnea]MTW09372.1 thioredoxin domain-containing protein [Massilia eburnea]
MRRIALSLALASLAAGNAFASPSNPVNGAEFRTLQQAQPTQKVEGKVEVIEFFMYHCPACYAVDNPLTEWARKNEDKVNFRRIHLSSGELRDFEARLYVTLEALQLQDAMYGKVLEAWHKEHRRLRSDEENLNWALRNGIDKEKFLSAYNSFGVAMRLKALARMADAYGVTGTPTIVVNGKFVTEPQMVAQANPNMPGTEVIPSSMQVLDALVARSRQ